MFANLRTALEEIGFLRNRDKADSLMHAVRHLIGRARPSEMEIKVLLGLARQIRWFVRHGSQEVPPTGEDPGG
jgi:tRNA/rRNA methyltransferase